MVAVSQAASPESNPDSLLSVNATVGKAPTVDSMIDQKFGDGVAGSRPCDRRSITRVSSTNGPPRRADRFSPNNCALPPAEAGVGALLHVLAPELPHVIHVRLVRPQWIHNRFNEPSAVSPREAACT